MRSARHAGGGWHKNLADASGLAAGEGGRERERERERERRPTGLTGGAAPRPGLWPLDGELRAAFEAERLLLDELPLDERAAAAEEDPDVELAALCGGGGSVFLGMLLDFTPTMTFGLSF
jgi:hypothetical protein